ncbi:hypothetical protein BGW38_001326 [Lunasporangiospora selenospora]|uniref:N-acetyltransferase domain-containing protein n=1 Tax=Lunasporangiospora selenospora TaxID=979761 RepID=A0A9P6KDL7_9FUNG|nr:hypothetical protein BGW38_001326 [Lunasporangiospora selenospora]
MRKACGWDAGMVPTWFVQQKEKTRIMAIFYLPGSTTPVGMGGIELVDFTNGDKSIADIDEKRGCVVSLFLYKKFRGRGYLPTLLSVCEELAHNMGLEELTIFGMSKAHGYEKFGFHSFKVETRNYGGSNNWETRFLKKSLLCDNGTHCGESDKIEDQDD